MCKDANEPCRAAESVQDPRGYRVLTASLSKLIQLIHTETKSKRTRPRGLGGAALGQAPRRLNPSQSRHFPDRSGKEARCCSALWWRGGKHSQDRVSMLTLLALSNQRGFLNFYQPHPVPTSTIVSGVGCDVSKKRSQTGPGTPPGPHPPRPVLWPR